MRVNVHSQFRVNLLVGWCGLTIGLVAALWIGMWAFDGPMTPPQGFQHYDSSPRRFLRLAHIAAVAIGSINILFARELPKLPLSARWKKIASVLVALAWFGMAMGCAAAALAPMFKYVLPVGACSLALASAIATIGVVRSSFHSPNKEAIHA